MTCDNTTFKAGDEMGSLLEIRKNLSLLIKQHPYYKPGDVFEVRLWHDEKTIFNGYFDDLDRMAEAILSHDAEAEGTYYLLNPVKKDCLAVADNRLIKSKQGTATTKELVLKRRFIGFDIDPVRNPKKISATDEEKELALEKAKRVTEFLNSYGWGLPAIGDSGNGYHLDYFTDLDNNVITESAFKAMYAYIAHIFDDDHIEVQGFHDANRVWKAYGTMTRKGQNVGFRPHRRSKLLEVPQDRKIITLEQITVFADKWKDIERQKVQTTPNPKVKSNGKLDIAKWITDNKIHVKKQITATNRIIYVLNECPFNPEHKDSSIIQITGGEYTGALSFNCFHNSCQDKKWQDVRVKYEPDAYNKKEKRERKGDTDDRKSVLNGAFSYIDAITEMTPIYFDYAGNFWLWDKENEFYSMVDETTILLTILKQIADLAIIQTKFKTELITAAKLRGRDAQVKEVPANWIHVKNGVVDIKTGEFFSATPEYLFTKPIPHNFVDKTETPTIDKLFGEWVPEDKVQLLYEIVAYCLYNGYPIHRMFILVGRGRNGKGQFRDLIVRLIGAHNRAATTIGQLISSRFETARLYHKKLATVGETDYSMISNTAIIKMLSGGDPIPMEWKNKNPTEFVNYAKLLINTNSLPQTSDRTDAYFSRCLVIEFCNQFQKGKDIIDTIPDSEYDALLTKCIGILKKLLEKGEFSGEGDIKAREQEYERLSNPITQFINTYCDINPDYYEGTWRLLKRYELFCSEKGFRKPATKNKFNDMLRCNYEVEQKNQVDYLTKKNKNWVWVFGLRLKDLPNLPILPEVPLNSRDELLDENVGKTGKTGKSDSGSSHKILPNATILDTSKTGKKTTELGQSQLDNLHHAYNLILRDYGDAPLSPAGIDQEAEQVKVDLTISKEEALELIKRAIADRDRGA